MKHLRATGFILSVGLALLMLLGGCMSAADSARAPVESAEVTMPPSYRFDPVAIRVPVGTTVTWRNTDNFTHAVSVVTGGYPELSLAPGQSGSITFDRPGEYTYICTYHAQNMKGTVSVR